MSLGFSTGLRALLTARRAMDVIGHNLANQNTPGYSRQIALLTTTPPISGAGLLKMGTGVGIASIRGVVNEALLNNIRSQLSTAGRYSAETDVLDQVEALLGDFSDNGLATKLQSFFDGATQAASKPEDSVLRQNLVALASDMALAFRTRSSGMQGFVNSTRLEAQTIVASANELLAEVANLNGHIKNQEINGSVANDLRDQRARALESLSELIGATATSLTDGTVTVSASGTVLVAGTSKEPLETTVDFGGGLTVRTAKGRIQLNHAQGRLGGLINMAKDYLPERLSTLDTLAAGFIQAINKIHSTGVPGSGPFTKLSSGQSVNVPPGVKPQGVTLSGAGLPFDIQKGTLEIAVSDLASGNVTRYQIDVDPNFNSVGDLVNAIDDIPELTASMSASGKLTITSLPGKGFDFSRRLDTLPVENATFGAANATAIAGTSFPTALVNGGNLNVSVDGAAPQTVFFNAVDFGDINNATAEEVAAVMNNQLIGVQASVVDGSLVLSSNSTGSTSSLLITDGGGSPAAALQMPASASGTNLPVDVTISGTPPEGLAGNLTFKVVGDGQIGVTPGLKVEVTDQNGNPVATLNVGEGYEPGEPLEVVEGVFVHFSPGDVQGSANQQFQLEVPGDTDTSGVLVAFGLNAVFTGSDAGSIEVNAALEANPNLLAGALSGGAGDGANFLKMAGLSGQQLEQLGDSSITAFYNQFAADIGATTAGTKSSLDASALVLITLESQRANVSGVNPDEELLQMERFQQLYDASARYLSVLNELNDTLLQI